MDSVAQLDHIASPNLLKPTWDSGQRFLMHAPASGKVLPASPSPNAGTPKTMKLRAFTKSTVVDPVPCGVEWTISGVWGHQRELTRKEVLIAYD